MSGTHAIYLTGNYLVSADDGHHHKHHDEEDDEDDYDMSPDEEELELLEDGEESDELDDLEDPRITEITSENEGEPPKLVKKKDEVPQKGKNKRVHEGSSDVETPAASLDDIMAKSLKSGESATNGPVEAEPKLSKKQLKKLRNNAGKAVEAAIENKEDAAVKGDKKVQFAKNLEQGPSASPSTIKSESTDKGKLDTPKEEGKAKASLGVKTIQGVKIDDKKLGTGPAAKKGDRVSLRYIGKLKDGKVFDCMA